MNNQRWAGLVLFLGVLMGFSIGMGRAQAWTPPSPQAQSAPALVNPTAHLGEECAKVGAGCSADGDCCGELLCTGGTCCIAKGKTCGPNGMNCCSRQCLNDNTCS